MSTSYSARVGAIQTRYKTDKNGKRVPKHYAVRWRVGNDRFEKTFPKRAQADSFRADLVSAARGGEAFDSASGQPVSVGQKKESAAWFDFACSYADMKWDSSSPNSRSSTADSLVAITHAMLSERPGRPDRRTVARALRLAFNKNARANTQHPEWVTHAWEWLARSTRPVSDLAKPDVLRSVVNELEKKQNGQRAASDTIRLRRLTLSGALDFAVERNLLDANPLDTVKAKKHRSVLKQVDRRSVVSPVQARTLLRAVQEDRPELYAFFALLYFAALRPEEAVNLRKHNLSLPRAGLGEIHLESAAPDIAAAWADSGRREERGLKHREDGVGRAVPCTDELTAILHSHMERYGTTADGRLFRAVRSDDLLSSNVYWRAWSRARESVFTPEVLASPLAKRPYDLRHAAVSTWLNATSSDAVRVAEWAGHSVSVLLRVYAKCIDGAEQQARERIARTLKGY